jgi:predicted lipoprotein with Yx(FWY)xxD motif
MKRLLMLVLAFGLVLGFGTVSFSMPDAVKIQQNDTVGKYVTDAEGMTLYWYKDDSPGKSSCAGSCIENWPIFYRETIAPPEGVDGADFGTITRDDGKKQTTFRGYPLYYWVKDKKPGETTGHDVRRVWFVVNPENFPPR